MINAAGYKVWPAELEALMFRHPESRKCALSAPTMLIAERRSRQWWFVNHRTQSWRSRKSSIGAGRRSAHIRRSRIIEFADALPKNASGKVMWRKATRGEFGAISIIDVVDPAWVQGRLSARCGSAT